MKPKKAVKKISIAQAKLLEQHLTKTSKQPHAKLPAKVEPKATTATVDAGGHVAPKEKMAW